MDPFGYTYTVGMTDEEVRDHLRAGTTGVLALASENDAYAVPVSYVYEDGSLLFRLSDDGHAKKLAFADATEDACFTLYEESGEESWSIVVEGTLHRLAADDLTTDAIASHDQFADLRVFDEAVEDVDLVGYELVPERRTGRRTPDHA